MEKKFLLMTTTWKKGETPTLKNISSLLKVNLKDLDKIFGVVNVDKENNIYAFQIEESKWSKLNTVDKNIDGPYSNTRIEPFDLEM